MLDAHVMRTGFGLRGRGRYDGTASVDGSASGSRAGWKGTDGRLRRRARAPLRGRGGLGLRGRPPAALRGPGPGGDAAPGRRGPARQGRGPRWTAALRGVDAEALVAEGLRHRAPPASAPPPPARSKLRWPRGRIRDLSGRVGLDLARAGRRADAARRPVGMARGGRECSTSSRRSSGPRPRRRGSPGRIARDDRADIAVEADSTDLAASDALGQRLRVALGNPRRRAPGLLGDGAFRGRWRGTVRRPGLRGTLLRPERRVPGASAGARRSGWATADALDGALAVARAAPAGRRAAARGRDGDGGLRRARRAGRARPLLALARGRLHQGPRVGRGDGRPPLRRGRRSRAGAARPSARCGISSASGRYHGVPYTDLEVEARLEGPSPRSARAARAWAAGP